MSIYKSSFVGSTLILLVLGTLVFAQGTQKTAPAKVLNPAELERSASKPSVEQAILRAAAAKLRADRRPSGAVEVVVTVNTTTRPAGCYTICVGSGVNRACITGPCTD